jgi:hypothetical protein
MLIFTHEHNKHTYVQVGEHEHFSISRSLCVSTGVESGPPADRPRVTILSDYELTFMPAYRDKDPLVVSFLMFNDTLIVSTLTVE